MVFMLVNICDHCTGDVIVARESERMRERELERERETKEWHEDCGERCVHVCVREVSAR